MTTATMDHGLYAVPPATTQQERLGLLLRIRRGARRALDAALALPRGAAGWVLRHTRTLVSALAGHPTLARIGNRLRDLAGLIRAAGPIPATVALVSIPAVWRATTRAARWVGSWLTAGTSAIWRRTRDTLARFGPSGVRIAQAMDHTGSAVSRFVTRVTTHPITQALSRSLKSVTRLVRPISQSLVVHRLAATFAAAPWLRVLLELVTLPFVIAPGLTVQMGRHLRPVPTVPSAPAAGAAANSNATETPTSTLLREPVPTEEDAWDELLTPRNRAERRAQQQAHAHAKRARARH